MSNPWPFWLYLLALAFLSLNPWLRPSSAPAPGGLPWDLIDHAIAYAGLALAATLALRERVRGPSLPALAAARPDRLSP